MDIQTVQKRSFNHAAAADEALAGGSIAAGNNLAVVATGQLGADGQPIAGSGNITATGANLTATAGQLALVANNDVTVQAASTEHASLAQSYYSSKKGLPGIVTIQSQSQSAQSASTSQVEASNLSGNSVLIQAGNAAAGTGDIRLVASNIGSTGATNLAAGRDVLIDTMEQDASQRAQASSSKSVELGIHQVNQIATQGAKVGMELADPFLGSKLPPPGFGYSSAKSSQSSGSSTQAVGSSISADTLTVAAGRDALIRGSTVVATGDMAIAAGRNLEILSSNNRQTAQDSQDKSKNGLFGSGGLGVTMGTQSQFAANQQKSETASASQVASLTGNIDLQAGKAYRQTGSQVLTLADPASVNAGDIAIRAKTVQIDPATDKLANAQQQRFSQSGVTLAISNPLITALQTGQQAAQNMGRTQGDARLQALAAATVAMSVAQAAQSIADGSAASIGISISAGQSKSSSSSAQTSSTAVTSGVSAARDLSITATEGDLTTRGAMLTAGRDASLAASGKIDLGAATNTATLEGKNQSSSVAVGVSFTVGQNTGIAFTASASMARGNENGSDLAYTNTTVKAGNSASLQSGGDTSLIGATVQANQVKADVGGNLNIQSLQDKSTFDAKQSGGGVGVSLCIPPICYGSSSVSVSVSQAKAKGDFLSVTEQSGIKTGDGGFQVNVAGGTNLTGGVISSSQAAIDANKNSLTTATLTTSDLQNKDEYKASAFAVSATVSGKIGDQTSEAARSQMNDDQKKAAAAPSKPSGSAGSYATKGSQSSVTQSGISAGAITITDDAAQKALTGSDAATTVASLNTQVTTDSNTGGALTKAWDGAKLMDKVQAGAQITASFGASAAKAVGDYAASKTKPITDANAYQDLTRAQTAGATLTVADTNYLNQLIKDGMTADSARATLADPQANADYQNWKEGGNYRIATQAAVGGLTTGSLGGALGAGATSAAAPAITDALNQLGLPEPVKQAAGMVIAAGIGTVAGGGAAGAVTGFNVDVNNRQLHPQERLLISDLAKDKAAKSCKSGDTQCINTQTIFWTDTLERVAGGIVDDKANAQNMAYLGQLVAASSAPNSEGARGNLDSYAQSLTEAQAMLAPYTGKVITVNGQAQTADGSAQTYFSATPAQRADTTANYVLGIQPPSSIVPGTALRDEARLEKARAQNGSAEPIYPVEELLLGGAVINRAVGLIGRAVGSEADVAFAGTVSPSESGYIGARKMTEEGLPVKLNSIDTAILKQLDTLPSTQAQGALREYIVDNYFLRNGYTKLEGKCGSGNCFDSVFVKGNQVIVGETKPMELNGSIKLSAGNPGTGLDTQFSADWTEGALVRLKASGPEGAKTAEIIRQAWKDGRLAKVVSGVNSSGVTIVKVPTTKP